MKKTNDNIHVKYSPDASLVNRLKLGDHYVEIWQGLPNLPFEPSASTGGRLGLRYETNDKYVWVTPNAAFALEQNQDEVLSATFKIVQDKKYFAQTIDATVGTTFGNTLESAISRAQELNIEELHNRIEKDRKKKLEAKK